MGLTLIIIGAIIVFILLSLLIRLAHFKKHLFLIIVILLLLFLYLTVSKVVKSENINLKTFDGIETAAKLYFSWLGHAFSNLKTVTANAIKMDWGLNKTEIPNKSKTAKK